MQNENLNGFIMNKDEKVVKIKDGKVDKILNKDLMPLYFLNHLSCEDWLKSRAIDSSRINSRLLKKALELQNKDDLSTVLNVNGACITDNYWFMDEHMQGLLYDINIKFSFNEYFDLALTGNFNDFNKVPSPTPELTNIGSFEKAWKKEENTWYLYKKGTIEEIFSEIFTFKLGEKLGFNMAEYEYAKPYIKSKNFTDDKKIFEPMSSIMNDNEDYNDNFNKLFDLDKNLAFDYLKIIYLDTLVFNVDRHTQNYGFLRSSKTGKILSLAPNFDNNLSLISRGYPKDITRENDRLLEFFTDFLEENTKTFNMFCNLDIKKISENDLDIIIDKMPKELIKDINTEIIKEFVLNGQNSINENINK